MSQPTRRRSFRQFLRAEEARQRIFAEERLGLWADIEGNELGVMV